MEKVFEALEDLEFLGDLSVYHDTGNLFKLHFKKEFGTIKQALIKAQAMEKENTYIEKVKTMLKQKDCVLRYVESEDCFAVKTMLSGWYKLTPQFVDNNVREEIKPLPTNEKIKQLKEENAEYKKAFDIIKEKRVDVFRFKALNDFNLFNSLQRSCKLPELTEEEYNLLREVL